jgi:hypothetical protein
MMYATKVAILFRIIEVISMITCINPESRILKVTAWHAIPSSAELVVVPKGIGESIKGEPKC